MTVEIIFYHYDFKKKLNVMKEWIERDNVTTFKVECNAETCCAAVCVVHKLAFLLKSQIFSSIDFT